MFCNGLLRLVTDKPLENANPMWISYCTKPLEKSGKLFYCLRIPPSSKAKKRMHGRGISSWFLNIFVNITTPPFIRHEWYAFKFIKLYTVLLTAYVKAHKFLSRSS